MPRFLNLQRLIMEFIYRMIFSQSNQYSLSKLSSCIMKSLLVINLGYHYIHMNNINDKDESVGF